MTHLLLAVMGQAKYVCAVHRFIQDLLLKAAPELLKGSGALKTDAEFKDTIDAAIASVTTPDARERDFIHAIVEASGAEMKPLCHLLRDVVAVGLSSALALAELPVPGQQTVRVFSFVARRLAHLVQDALSICTVRLGVRPALRADVLVCSHS